MSQPKFTPGPRRAYQDPVGDWHVDNWSPRSGNHDGLIVARFGHGHFSEGNAKLDAAAPDLYAALAWLEQLPPGARADFWCAIREVPGAKEWANQWRAALAKARGEEAVDAH